MLILSASSHLMRLKFPETLNFKSQMNGLDVGDVFYSCTMHHHASAEASFNSPLLHGGIGKGHPAWPRPTSQKMATNLSTMITKFDNFFKVHKNIIFSVPVSTVIHNRKVRQQNSSLVCTSWSRTVTIAPCRTKWSETTLLLAFRSKPYHKTANGLWTDPREGQNTRSPENNSWCWKAPQHRLHLPTT